MRIRLYPYEMASMSAKNLAAGLDALRIRNQGRYSPKNGDIIVDWGNSDKPAWMDKANELQCKILNHPSAVACASHKIESYRAFDAAGVPTPEWTCDKKIAAAWLASGKIVVARKLLRASGGAGIVLVNPQNYPSAGIAQHALPAAGCYTVYTEHSGEYRIHIFKGQVLDFVKKKKMSNEKLAEHGFEFDPYIRNYHRGWVFAREAVELPEGLAETAINAVAALKLDFGAVDCIYSKKQGAFVLEVNTAPGLEGQTLESYISAIKKERL